MLKFSGKLTLVSFDEVGYKKAFDEAMAIAVRQAAREWLRAVIPKVPVFTGMARGSLQPLGRILNVAVPISPDPRAHEYRGKTPEAGAAQSRFEFGRNNGEWFFGWDTDVLHFIINEYNNMSGILPLRHSTPWYAINAGNKAFKKYLDENLPKRVPDLADWIRVDTKKSR